MLSTNEASVLVAFVDPRSQRNETTGMGKYQEVDTLAIRPATVADLDAAWDVFYANETRDEAEPPPRGAVQPYLAHVLATGKVLVAEEAGRIVGFAGLV